MKTNLIIKKNKVVIIKQDNEKLVFKGKVQTNIEKGKYTIPTIIFDYMTWEMKKDCHCDVSFPFYMCDCPDIYEYWVICKDIFYIQIIGQGVFKPNEN
jgi:hypothetical protein